jgi:hypothetical protein
VQPRSNQSSGFASAVDGDVSGAAARGPILRLLFDPFETSLWFVGGASRRSRAQRHRAVIFHKSADMIITPLARRR